MKTINSIFLKIATLICKVNIKAGANLFAWWMLKGQRSFQYFLSWFPASREAKAVRFWFWFFRTIKRLEIDHDCDGTMYSGTLGGLYMSSSPWGGFKVSLTIFSHYFIIMRIY